MPQPALLVVGARGLGRDLALHFARAGFQVCCAARTKADVDAVAAETGGRGLVADLADPASLQRLLEACGAPDLAVCAQTSGAPFRAGPLLEADPEQLRRRLDAMVLGSLRFIQALAPRMPAGGTLVQIGTTLASAPRPGFGALSSPQFALRALVATAAQELKPRLHVAYLAVEGQLATLSSKAWMERHGEARAIPPQEVARAIEYLHGQDPRAWTHELSLRPASAE
jgi:NAD(P)-dependent dehydrogenase (short-subunit alcohol dehydrogenase family)